MKAPTQEQIDACCKQIRDWLAAGRVLNGPCATCGAPPRTAWMDNEDGKVRRPDGTFLCWRCNSRGRGYFTIDVSEVETADQLIAVLAAGFQELAKEGFTQGLRLSDEDGLVIRKALGTGRPKVTLIAERP